MIVIVILSGRDIIRITINIRDTNIVVINSIFSIIISIIIGNRLLSRFSFIFLLLLFSSLFWFLLLPLLLLLL